MTVAPPPRSAAPREATWDVTSIFPMLDAGSAGDVAGPTP